MATPEQARLAELEAERGALQAELETQLAIRNRCRDAETALNQGVEDAMAERKRVKELSARARPPSSTCQAVGAPLCYTLRPDAALF